jgi:hypothetical protein
MKTPNKQIITLCAWPWCDERSKEQREEDLAKSMGKTRDEIMHLLSHGMCNICFERETSDVFNS